MGIHVSGQVTSHKSAAICNQQSSAITPEIPRVRFHSFHIQGHINKHSHSMSQSSAEGVVIHTLLYISSIGSACTYIQPFNPNWCLNYQEPSIYAIRKKHGGARDDHYHQYKLLGPDLNTVARCCQGAQKYSILGFGL